MFWIRHDQKINMKKNGNLYSPFTYQWLDLKSQHNKQHKGSFIVSPIYSEELESIFWRIPQTGVLYSTRRAICLKIFLLCFILLFTSSSPCRKADQFAVSYFSTSLIVLIQVYNWEIRHQATELVASEQAFGPKQRGCSQATELAKCIVTRQQARWRTRL